MKRLIIGLITLVVMLMETKAMADIKQDSVKVILLVMEIVGLNIVEPQIIITPSPEDYASKMNNGKNFVLPCSRFPEDDYGFADRAGAIKIKMFTNAAKGARVYVHALANPEHNKSLRVKDIYLSVTKEKTYVLTRTTIGCVCNLQEGISLCRGLESSSSMTNQQKCMKIVMSGLDDAFAVAFTGYGSDVKTSWLQMDNEAKLLFGVGKATKATRLWVLNIGIANLARYTENLAGYEANLTFTLMPTVT